MPEAVMMAADACDAEWPASRKLTLVALVGLEADVGDSSRWLTAREVASVFGMSEGVTRQHLAFMVTGYQFFVPVAKQEVG